MLSTFQTNLAPDTRTKIDREPGLHVDPVVHETTAQVDGKATVAGTGTTRTRLTSSSER